jgi:hypothetical protein
MMNPKDRVLTALLVISGSEPGFDYWDAFSDKPRPERDPKLSSFGFREEIGKRVKRMACCYLAGYIMGGG